MQDSWNTKQTNKMFSLLISVVIFSAVFGKTIISVPDDFELKIVGGVETTIEQYPYQVSVTYLLQHTCGGSIISARFVVTAAHCTYGRKSSPFNIRVGTSYSDDYNEPGVVYFVQKIIQHEHFSIDTVDNDISLIKTTDPIAFNSKVQPIPLQTARVDVTVNSIVTVTGWGALEEDSYAVNKLRKVALKVVNTNECNRNYGGQITQHMFCAQRPGKDACQGDSGGPVALNGRLVGIVSWGIGCARPDFPGVFTKLSSLRTWIDRHMRD